MDKVRLQRSGLEVSRFGLGTLTLGKSQLNLSIEEGAKIIAYAIEKGICFFDTAEYYKTYEYLAAGLRLAEERVAGFRAEDAVICSKSYAKSYSDMMEAVHEAREALGRETIDIFLLHEVRSKEDLASREEAWLALQDLKKQGIIRAIGLSTHHADICEMAAEIPEPDIVLTLLNRQGMGIRKGNDFGTAEDMLSAVRRCKEAGKDVLSMKVFGGGNLSTEYQAALRYILAVTDISASFIGFSGVREIDELCDFLDGKLESSYQPDVNHKRIMVDQADCEGCGACLKKCPQGAIHYNARGLAEVDSSKCLTCGYCAYACPVRAIILL